MKQNLILIQTGTSAGRAESASRASPASRGEQNAKPSEQALSSGQAESTPQTLPAPRVPPYIRSAVLKGGELVEFFVENQEQPSQVGAIYKARVVQKGLSSYFVDLGKGESAFLSLSHSPQRSNQSTLQNDSLPNSNHPLPSAPLPHKKTASSVKTTPKVGQYLMVQIIKDSLGSKNQRVSQKISLPSAHLVYLPQDPTHIGISRQIEDPALREKLINYFQKEKDNGGWIVRTKAGSTMTMGADSGLGSTRKTSCARGTSSTSDVDSTIEASSVLKAGVALKASSALMKSLKKEAKELKKLWQDLSQKYRSKKRPGLIYSPLGFGPRLIRDFLTEDIEEIWVDDKALFLEIKNFMKTHIPKEKQKLKLYQSQTLSLFDKYDLEPELKKLIEKKVKLHKGGFIILEETEAAVVVDVNSGRFRGRKTTEENILKVNLSAAEEITRQLRLRNCGGIVLIDFIDMEKEESRQKLMEELALLLKKDRAPTNLFPLSELSIAQITRKRERPSLKDVLLSPCPHCEGRGYIYNSNS